MDALLSRLDVTRLLTELVAFLPELITALAIIVLFWAVYRASRGPLVVLLKRYGLHHTLVTMLVGNVYRVIVVGFGLVMAADQIGVNVRAALAGLGVAGLTVGFAAQDSLANIVAGFMIFIDQPFQVGDWITVSGEYGSVSNVTMRSTRIRTPQNTYVIIPNKTILESVLVNHSKHGETRVDVPVGIAYKEDILRARETLLEAVQTLEGIVHHPAPDVVVMELGDSSVNLNVRVWIDQASQELPVFVRVMEAGKLALDAAGIEIPFPHLQLFVEQVEDRVWQKVARFVPPAGHASATMPQMPPQ